MRGVQAFWKAPLILLFSLLTTCTLDFRLKQPALEIDFEVAFISADNITVHYKFSVDEPVLRCRYRVTHESAEIISDVTNSVAPEVWNDQPLDLPVAAENGKYELRLVIQAERSGEFVDLSFLDETRIFYIDNQAPFDPPAPGGATTFSAGYMHVFLTHPELTAPQASPVNIHYTLDSADPTRFSTEYNLTTGIVRPVSDFGLPLKAKAFDLAGNSGPVYSQPRLFEDSVAPVEAVVDLSDTLRFKDARRIYLTHQELTEPTGSPVTLYFTLDGTDPDTSSSIVPSTGIIELPFDSAMVSFRCIATDEAGNSSPILSRNYKFTSITSTNPAILRSQKNFVAIELFGFGLVGVARTDITMEDSQHRPILLFYNTESEDYIYFLADLTAPEVSTGMATIKVTVPDAGPVVHILDFEILP